MNESKYEHYLKFIPGVRFWIIVTGVIVAFAALKTASHIVNIFLVAAFLTAISMAPLNWLKKKGVNKTVANIIVILTVVVLVGLIGLVIGSSLSDFSDKMPFYHKKFEELWNSTINMLYQNGMISHKISLKDVFNSGKIVSLMAPVASEFGNVLSGVLIIFIFFIFMMFESDMFSRKMMFISKESSNKAEAVMHQVRNYFGIKTLMNLATGVSLGLMLYLLKVDFPVLWGFLAFLLNYIPSIGSFLAAVPAVITAFILHGPVIGVITIIGYFVINTLIGNVIEPQLMGKNLGISPFVVFFSMIFFSYILGPVGMLIATPLAIIIKIIFDSREVTRGLGIMLGDGRELEEAEEDAQSKKNVL